MKQMVSYKLKPDRVAENEALVLAVFKALNQARPAGLSYATFRQPDGVSFIHTALISTPDNPLTARVFVNRVWQHHFGEGLVRTPSNLGALGEKPTHPGLLDWLTAEFIASGWSVKALHRLILESKTYQAASDDDAENLRLDPGNRWLWRFARRPLDAEAIRDAMLAIPQAGVRNDPVQEENQGGAAGVGVIKRTHEDRARHV